MKYFLIIFVLAIISITTEAQLGRRHRHPSNFQHSHQWRMRNQGNEDDYGQAPVQEEDYGQQNLFDEDADAIQQTVNEDIDEFSGIVQQPQEKPQIQPPRPIESVTSKIPIKYQEGTPEITTKKGTFRGKTVKTHNGKTVYAFLGIPYAKPPVSDLRFKRPVPAGILNSPFDATELPNACNQENIQIFPEFDGEKVWFTNTNISEDCLYLNIWVPQEVIQSKDTELASVLFWIYGGGFMSGSNSLDVYNGAILASQENVIVVSAQYRLGPLGFLYFGTEDAPGNMGLLDQNLAILWVHENIDSFGGDSNSVTLFGESAGSASVGYHLLSPLSKSLFKRVVMMSGPPTEVYSFSPPNVMKKNSYKLAKLAGCNPRQGPSEVASCLRNVDPQVLVRLQWQLYKKMAHFVFIPTIDGQFLTDFPSNLILNGEAKRADLMIGTVNTEGSYFALYEYLKYNFQHDNSTSVSRDDFKAIMKNIFSDYSDIEREAILTYYTNWKNPEDGLMNQKLISDAIGDAYFVCPVRLFADAWSNRGLNVFYYHFTQRTSSNPWAEWMGTLHADEIEYFFGHPLNSSNPKTFTSSEQQLSTYMMKLLTNFAKLGVPSENWERYYTETPVYLDLNATKISDKSTSDIFGPRAEHCALWNRLLPQLKQASMRQRPNRQFQNRHLDSDDHWTHTGTHGGQGFHINSFNHDSCHSSSVSNSNSNLQSPVQPAQPKNFGQNKPITHGRGGFGKNRVQWCKNHCESAQSEDSSPVTPIPV